MATRPISRVAFPTPSCHTQLAFRPICRAFSSTTPVRVKDKNARLAAQKLKQKGRKNPYYKCYDLKEIEQFALCDAIRYIRAFEVHKASETAKFEVHVKLKTRRSGPVIRPNQLKLPHPVKSDVTFAVICPPDSKQAREAKEAGAVLVGEENIFEIVKSGKIPFDRLIAHPNSMPRLQKEGVGRILGPKGLMPNVKNNSITADPAALLRELVGGALYGERLGVVRMAIGRMSFTPEMVRDNLQALLTRIKDDIKQLNEDHPKGGQRSSSELDAGTRHLPQRNVQISQVTFDKCTVSCVRLLRSRLKCVNSCITRA